MSREISRYPTASADTFSGIQNVVKVATPAAGAEWTFTFPGGYFYRILSGFAQLVTSAVAANRFPGWHLTDGNIGIGHFTGGSALTAGGTYNVGYLPGTIAANTSATGGGENVVMPNVWIPPNYVLTSKTVNIDVGDQYSQVVLWLEQWDYGAFGKRVGGME